MYPEEMVAIKNLFSAFPMVNTLEFRKEGKVWGFAMNGSILPFNLIFPENNWSDADKAWLVEQEIPSEAIKALRENDVIPPRPFFFHREEFL